MQNTKHFMAVLFSLVFLTIIPCHANNRDEEVINMQHIGNHDDHFIFPIPADQPDVYYNHVSQTIIIDGIGEVNFYDVEILSLTTFETEISTQVNGYYDTIDISSLSVGEYVIIIDSPTGNSFEGFLRWID